MGKLDELKAITHESRIVTDICKDICQEMDKFLALTETAPQKAEYARMTLEALSKYASAPTEVTANMNFQMYEILKALHEINTGTLPAPDFPVVGKRIDNGALISGFFAYINLPITREESKEWCPWIYVLTVDTTGVSQATFFQIARDDNACFLSSRMTNRLVEMMREKMGIDMADEADEESEIIRALFEAEYDKFQQGDRNFNSLAFLFTQEQEHLRNGLAEEDD